MLQNPETCRARKVTFISSVSENGELYAPWNFLYDGIQFVNKTALWS